MNFVIIGSSLTGNKGGAAMLESSIQDLIDKKSQSKFVLFSMYQVAEEQAQNNRDNLRVLRATPIYLALVVNTFSLLWRLVPFARPLIEKIPQIKALSVANALLDQGGITFVDGREKFLLYNIATILPALFMKVPVVKCAQALGPFNGFINRLAAKIFLPKMALIVSRGEITYKHLADLGLDNIIMGADYAFLLKPDNLETMSIQKKVELEFFKKGKVIGISPSVVLRKKAEASGKDYVGLMVELIDWLTNKKGYKVALIPHSVRMDTIKAHNNDMPMCKEIYDRINNKQKCLFINQELSPGELRYVIGQCNLFVASRFHAMVSALAMKVPVLVMGWSHKYKEVLDMFELGSWAFSSDKLSDRYLKHKFYKLEKEQHEIRELLSRHLPKVQQESHKQTDEILRITTKNIR